VGRRRLPLDQDLRLLSERMRTVAAAQGGVITTQQSRTLGADEITLRRLLRTELWMRARRSVYRDTSMQLPSSMDAAHHQECAALLASLTGPAVVSHLSAARLLSPALPPGSGD
jgi:hypothetical protein